MNASGAGGGLPGGLPGMSGATMGAGAMDQNDSNAKMVSSIEIHTLNTLSTSKCKGGRRC